MWVEIGENDEVCGGNLCVNIIIKGSEVVKRKIKQINFCEYLSNRKEQCFLILNVVIMLLMGGGHALEAGH